jgi:hypothetical protein
MLEIVLTLTQDSERLAPNVIQPQKSFWTHSMELLGYLGHVEYRFGSFGDSASVGAG